MSAGMDGAYQKPLVEEQARKILAVVKTTENCS
jgi:hypothetical protein